MKIPLSIHFSLDPGTTFDPVAMQVSPVAFRYESIWACKRPVYNSQDWANKAEEWIGKRATMDSRYDWKVNWIGWEKWFREGIA